MKRLLSSLVLLAALAGSAQADIVLGTSNPAGTPLDMSAGSTSGLMFVNIVSDNPANDVMSGWNITLAIVADSGATGTLTFQDPATGTASNPPNYIFGTEGLGIGATNGGSTLSANDFFVGAGLGVAVPGGPGANLLQMDFLASSNASGLFGIYAMEGAALTEWTDGIGNQQLFTNVPAGSGMVQIGEVSIAQSAVPEPSSLLLLGLGGAAVAVWKCRRTQTTESKNLAGAARSSSD
jgi:PEP-CTERM motif